MTPRAQARLVARGAAPGTPLFLPLAHRLAAAIDGLAFEEFLSNPTKLARGLDALYRALETDGIVTGSLWDVPLPADPEAALGHSRVAAALEATRRLAATVPGEPVLAVLLPTSLETPVAVDLTRRFSEAGVSAIFLLAAALPEDEAAVAAWRARLTTVTKMARFHQAMTILVATAPEEGLGEWLRNAVPPGVVLPAMLADDPSRWMVLPPRASLVTTRRELSSEIEIASLRDACIRIRPTA